MLRTAKALLIGFILSLILAFGVNSQEQNNSCKGWFNLNSQSDNINQPMLVDYNKNGNLLVRGPLPLIVREGSGNNNSQNPCLPLDEWTFAYGELEKAIKNIDNPKDPKNYPFPPPYLDKDKQTAVTALFKDNNFHLENYNVIDISLIGNDPNGDGPALQAEIKAFGLTQNDVWVPGPNQENWPPDKITIHHGPLGSEFVNVKNHPSGQIVWWPVGFWDCGNGLPADFFCNQNHGNDDSGCKPWPEETPYYCDPLKVLGNPGYDFIGLINFLTDLLNGKDNSGKPRLIYFHCIWGSDRTSSVHMAYLLLNHYATSFCDAKKYAKFYIGDHYPNLGSQRLVKAYCHYLNASDLADCDSNANCPSPNNQTGRGQKGQP